MRRSPSRPRILSLILSLFLTLSLTLSLLLSACSSGSGTPATDVAADLDVPVADATLDTASDTPASDPSPADAADSGPEDAETLDVPADPGTDPGPTWTEAPLEPSAAFLARRATWLDACAEAHAPGKGSGLYGQACRVAKGLPVDPAPILAKCDMVDARKDTADFGVTALVRILLLDRKTGALDAATRTRIEKTVLGFKYWLDEPGKDKMCYWSENHQALFHSSELMAGLLFPDAVFTNDGKTGKQHADHARPYIDRWLGFRERLGFSEWHSNVYLNEDIPALLNLAEFADDPAVRARAAIIVDELALDHLANMFKGVLATAHGRTYEGHLVPDLSDSTREFAWLAVNLAWTADKGSFSAVFLATNTLHFPHPVLEEAAAAALDRFEHRQRDGIDIEDGPAWGIGYESADDIVFWAGMSAIMAPEVILGTSKMLDDLDLWDGFLFGDIPANFRELFQSMAEAGTLKDLATQMQPVAEGIATQAMNTYTYRTPQWQLSGAQDYHPGLWGAQTNIWQAALNKDAHVFTTFPSRIDGLGPDLEFAGEWTGSWQPRATFFRNVGVIRYRKQSVPMFDDLVTAMDPHAFFPQSAFDEVRQSAGWTFGRKGGAWIGLWSQHPTAWAEGRDYDLTVPGADGNAWVVEMGDDEAGGTFDAFVAALSAAKVEVGDAVHFDSPSVGAVDVGWDGPMTVAGTAVDLGPYKRFDNALVVKESGELRTVVTVGTRRADLDFEGATRRLLVVETP